MPTPTPPCSSAAAPALHAATASALLMMIAAAPVVAAGGALTVLTLIALLLCSLSALLAVLYTLELYAAAASLMHPNLLLVLAVCAGALLGPIVPAAMHMCVRMSRDLAAEGSAIGLCAASFRLAVLLLAVAPLLLPLHPLPLVDGIVCWLPLVLSAAAAARCVRMLRSTRRIRAQDVRHEKGAFGQAQMNGSAAAAFKVKDVQATLRSERVLKKWAFGYLCLTFESWKVKRWGWKQSKHCPKQNSLHPFNLPRNSLSSSATRKLQWARSRSFSALAK